MLEKDPYQENGESHESSILTREFVEQVLAAAKENLEKDGSLVPILFLHFKDGSHVIAPLLSLPSTADEKESYFAALGREMRRTGHVLTEAVFVSESWYVVAEKGKQLSLDVSPSQHPRRKEAITIIGRDAAKIRFSMVVQPLSRDQERRPVFGPIEIAEYGSSAEGRMYPKGLIDHLFPGRVRNSWMN